MTTDNKRFWALLFGLSVATLCFTLVVGYCFMNITEPIAKDDNAWIPPSLDQLGTSSTDSMILYGRELIVNTANYLGPKGKVLHNSNGMNCQNCHLEAGTKLYGNNYSMVASTYPKYRARSGTIEGIYKRVNDCMERSLNGKALDTASREMQAIKAYILWLGKDVRKNQKVTGAGITTLDYMHRAASSTAGKTIYEKQCQSCHQAGGEGVLKADSASYEYPPLWGAHSYNIGAGLYRLSRIAGYVKSNMPNGTSYAKPALTDEEAWDVAAYINSLPRPIMDISRDWKRIAAKPIDHPFGPYADTFSEQRHKYGPYTEMVVSK